MSKLDLRNFISGCGKWLILTNYPSKETSHTLYVTIFESINYDSTIENITEAIRNLGKCQDIEYGNDKITFYMKDESVYYLYDYTDGVVEDY